METRKALGASLRLQGRHCSKASSSQITRAAIPMLPAVRMSPTVCPRETHTCLISCWRWASGNVCKEELLAPRTRLRFLPLPQVLFLILVSFGVCHKSQRAQANVGVSAERQPTASCAGHLHSGIIPLYSISELYFSGYFLRVPAQLYLGSLIPYFGHCSLPRCCI